MSPALPAEEMRKALQASLAALDELHSAVADLTSLVQELNPGANFDPIGMSLGGARMAMMKGRAALAQATED